MKLKMLFLCIICFSFTLIKKPIQIKGIVNEEFLIVFRSVEQPKTIRNIQV